MLLREESKVGENIDEITFESLVKDYHHALCNLAQGFVGAGPAEEVVQEAWLSVFQNLSKFEKRASLKTWIFKITTNKALSYLRKHEKELEQTEIQYHSIANADTGFQSHNSGFHETQSDGGNFEPATLLITQETLTCIEKVLLGLPKKQQLVFKLSYFDHHHHAFICDQLGISHSNYKVLLYRARSAVLKMLTQYRDTGIC